MSCAGRDARRRCRRLHPRGAAAHLPTPRRGRAAGWAAGWAAGRRCGGGGWRRHTGEGRRRGGGGSCAAPWEENRCMGAAAVRLGRPAAARGGCGGRRGVATLQTTAPSTIPASASGRARPPQWNPSRRTWPRGRGRSRPPPRSPSGGQQPRRCGVAPMQRRNGTSTPRVCGGTSRAEGSRQAAAKRSGTNHDQRAPEYRKKPRKNDKNTYTKQAMRGGAIRAPPPLLPPLHSTAATLRHGGRPHNPQ